jgi:serine protease AprX
MKRAKGLLLFALSILLLAACSQTTPGAGDALETLNRGKGKGPKPIVEEPVADPVSACVALYASGEAQAATTNAVIDPALDYGQVGTLILSFNFEDALAPAASFISSALGLEQGEGLGVFENLPMLAVQTLITPELVRTLQSNLQGYGLLSIYQDRQLQYFLRESGEFIGAPQARAAFDVTGKGVGVAVLDSGVDGLQGDFANMTRNVKIVAPIVSVGVGGYFTLDTVNSDPTSGHGTHVAGTIGGTGEVSNGRYVGMAPEANLVGIGAGDALFILYALQGFDFAMNPDVRETHNIRVISNSWGTTGRFAPFHPISIATKRAYDLGMIVNFAAGNEGPNPDTLNPYSASPCAMSTAAGSKEGQLVDFSSRGIPGDEFHHPDITAPGQFIVAARATTGAVTPPFTGDLEYGAFYSRISGTSMATPHVSGVIALMLEANPSLDLDSTLEILSATAKPMFDGARQRELWEVGAGYIDAFAAVKAAAESAGSRLVVTTQTLQTWTGTVSPAVSLIVTDPVQAEHNYSLSVPAGASALRIETDWGNPAYDLDLYVYDPSGNLIASSADFGTPSEAVAIPSPAAGSYRVQLKGYLNGPTSYTGTAEVDTVTTK